MKEWRVPVTWMMGGTVKVKADSLEEAMQIVDDDPAIGLPDDGEYLDGTFLSERELSLSEIRDLYNDGEKDEPMKLGSFELCAVPADKDPGDPGIGLPVTDGIVLIPIHANGQPMFEGEIEQFEEMDETKRKDLYSIFLARTKKNHPLTDESIKDVLQSEARKRRMDYHPDRSPVLRVIQGEHGFYGATAFFCSGVQEKLSQKYGDYYMLPSSIHEVLIAPVSEFKGYTKEDFCQIVLDGNSQLPRSEDRLSDQAYFYNSKEKTLVPCKEPEEVKEKADSEKHIEE